LGQCLDKKSSKFPFLKKGPFTFRISLVRVLDFQEEDPLNDTNPRNCASLEKNFFIFETSSDVLFGIHLQETFIFQPSKRF
jgi:hypothetical protein